MTDYTIDFDRFIDRRGTCSLKYDAANQVFGSREVLPMWVADMDFAAPDFILDTIRQRCDHGVLGYTITPPAWSEAICSWLDRRHNWQVDPAEIGYVSGVVSGIAFAIQCFSKPGDKVLIQTPVYPPFMHIPQQLGRELAINKLVNRDHQLYIDFDDFEQQAASGCKLFILCSPHNPGGRIWTVEELQKMAEICLRYQILIIADEIHADLILPGSHHHPLASLSPAIADQVITLMAPSKTFNIPGIGSSFFIIHQEERRKQYQQYLESINQKEAPLFSVLCTQAAYEQGDDWLNQLLRYLHRNVQYVTDFIESELPVIQACVPQASFLIWLDCRPLNLNPDELSRFFIRQASLGLNPGHSFGPGGEGFMRLNIGCRKEVVIEAMERLKRAVNARFS